MDEFPHEIPPIEELERMTPEELNALPFGAMLVDEAGTIVDVNQREAARVGQSPEEFIGRDFFRDVAPCANVKGFADAFRAGAREGRMRKIFGFRYPDGDGGEQDVTIYLGSASPGYGWILATLEPVPE